MRICTLADRCWRAARPRVQHDLARSIVGADGVCLGALSYWDVRIISGDHEIEHGFRERLPGRKTPPVVVRLLTRTRDADH
jgi:hypothetical protein